ncbi:polysaccharide pyruvyl transferase family protein [Salinilacustrithrix flava]|uniref:polysaccharide pyruvyl transferase family protein n=1 Tax=Salinilacustrithrix flava TaxID=2957203 RepID=UPI003D7C2837
MANYCVADLDLAHPDGTILFHGGGNFSDYWPGFQEFRRRVMFDLPTRRYLQLPQTVAYRSDQTTLEPDTDFLRRCRDLHVLVRDERSLRMLTELGNLS